ncbi:MAG: MlaD family protein [Acidobacteriota bacterium]|nr:MlaD family protein [Acidobacteriota bacterium]
MAELEIKPTPGIRLRVTGLVVVAVAISMMLVYLLVGGGQDFFARRATLTTYIPDASGITPDSEVRLSGIRIGTVTKAELSGELNPARAVHVEMRVLSRYLKNIPEDSKTDISADTLVGYQFIDIVEGKSPLPIAEDGVLHSEPVKEAVDRADLIRTLQNNLSQVDQILADMASPHTKIGAFVAGENEYDTLLSRIRGFDTNLHTFLTPQSELGKTFYTDQMYNRIRNALARADESLVSIQKGEGTAGGLFASDRQYEDFLRSLRALRTSLADANAGKGAFGSILRDDESYRKIFALLKDTDGLISALNAGEGSTGRLLTSAQLYESLNGSLRSMELLLRDLRENPRKYLRFKPF